MSNNLFNFLNGQHPIIYIVSQDERFIFDQVIKYSKENDFNCLSWDYYRKGYNLLTNESCLTFDKKLNKDVKVNSNSFIKKYISNYDEKNIIIFPDSHTIFSDINKFYETKATNIRMIKDFAQSKISQFSSNFYFPFAPKEQTIEHKIIFISPILSIPKELEHLVYVVDFSLPSREHISFLLDNYILENNISFEESFREEIINSCFGLSESEIIIIIKNFFSPNYNLDIHSISKEKQQLIKRDGILSIVESDVVLDDIGGFDFYKEWIAKRKLLLTEENRKTFNLDFPKGSLLTGVPGCGKSLIAKGLANYWNLPLIRFDIGNVLGSKLGESDKNLRNTLKKLDNLSPCILWIDEIEKSSPKNDGSNHEVSSRIFGRFLNWLQEKKSFVFVFATANDISSLPPEFLRKGRFDEIFFVDLPSKEERKKIFEIHLAKHNIDFSSFDLDNIAYHSKGFSGSEIESVVQESILSSIQFKTELNEKIIVNEINNISPLSVTMKESVKHIREWCFENQIKPASFINEELNNLGKVGFFETKKSS